MVGKNVKIATGSIGFTCDKDNNTVTKFYPRENKDPAYNTSVAVGATTLNTVILQIGVRWWISRTITNGISCKYPRK